MNAVKGWVILSAAILLTSGCAKRLDFDWDVPAAHYHRHVFKKVGKAGAIQGDFQLVGLHKDPNRKWYPGFDVGCSDGKRNAFKLVALARSEGGKIRDGVMSIGVAGLRDKEIVTSKRLMAVEAGKTYHFEYSWTAGGHYSASVDGRQESASGIRIPHKQCRLFASSVHVKFSNVIYEGD
ncbi:MAG: hypothetical protein P8090_14060 [Gammaproteobacteria bacterium]